MLTVYDDVGVSVNQCPEISPKWNHMSYSAALDSLHLSASSCSIFLVEIAMSGMR